MEKPQAIRILIVDDHPIVREALTAVIGRQEDMTVVGQATDGKTAVEMYAQLTPDVTLLDLRLPVMDGISALIAMRNHNPAARVIILTAFDQEEDIYRGLRAGAKAYLIKDTPTQVVLDTIRSVHLGQTCIAPDIATKLAERMVGPEVTPRELEVLRLLMLGTSNRSIAAALHISEGTVKTHVNNILGKLGANDRTQAVTIALKRGLISLP